MTTASELRSGKTHRDENFPVASWIIHPRHRALILAFYNFVRTADEAFHFEPPSTRVLVTAAQLIAAGAGELEAAEACILAPLSTDGAISEGLREVAAAGLLTSETL